MEDPGGQVAGLLRSWVRVASLRRRCLDLNFRTQECREGFGQREHLGRLGRWGVAGGRREPGRCGGRNLDVGVDHDRGKGQRPDSSSDRFAPSLSLRRSLWLGRT